MYFRYRSLDEKNKNYLTAFKVTLIFATTLLWHRYGRDGVSNHQPHDCLLNRLFREQIKKKLKLRVNGLCVGNSPVTGEFPAQMASNAENVSIWWRHDEMSSTPRQTIT